MSKHTPGPWHVEKPFVKADDRGMVLIGAADSRGRPFMEGEEMANLVLIAAAPDLLEALKELIETRESYSDVLNKARAAIAKAEGGAG